jgi:hypothetical protein
MKKCVECGELRDIDEDDDVCSDCYDPTPWCHVCHAQTSARCSCGPIAENN